MEILTEWLKKLKRFQIKKEPIPTPRPVPTPLEPKVKKNTQEDK